MSEDSAISYSSHYSSELQWGAEEVLFSTQAEAQAECNRLQILEKEQE